MERGRERNILCYTVSILVAFYINILYIQRMTICLCCKVFTAGQSRAMAMAHTCRGPVTSDEYGMVWSSIPW